MRADNDFSAFGKGFHQLRDDRDAAFPLFRMLGEAEPGELHSKVWSTGSTLDQGQSNSCVGQTMRQLLNSQPFQQLDGPDAFEIYDEARDNDEFPPGTEGTSLRAGLEVLRRRKMIVRYYWAKSAQEIAHYLAKYGPVPVGTPWLAGMNHPSKSAAIIRAMGNDTGGHAYLFYGVNFENGYLYGINSWGPVFGAGGRFKISLEDVDKLLRMGGVAAGVQEKIAA